MIYASILSLAVVVVTKKASIEASITVNAGAVAEGRGGNT